MMKVVPGRNFPLAVALVLLIAGTTSGGEDVDRALTVTTSESDGLRRVVVTAPRVGDRAVTVAGDSTRGSFSIEVTGVDVNRYRGALMLEDRGRLPVRLCVLFPDSGTIRVQGETLPYSRIEGFSTLGGGGYVLEIHRTAQPATPKAAVVEGSIIGGGAGGLSSRWSKLARAFEIAAMMVAALLVMATIFFALDPPAVARVRLILRKPKTDEGNGDRPAAPLDRETVIREMMSSRRINYDEAVILLNVRSRGRGNPGPRR